MSYPYEGKSECSRCGRLEWDSILTQRGACGNCLYEMSTKQEQFIKEALSSPVKGIARLLSTGITTEVKMVIKDVYEDPNGATKVVLQVGKEHYCLTITRIDAFISKMKLVEEKSHTISQFKFGSVYDKT